MRVTLGDLFGFTDQEIITNGRGYELTSKRNNNTDPFIRAGGADAAKIVIKQISL